MAKNKPVGPSLYDYTMWQRAGVNPKNGLPDRLPIESELKTNMKIQLRVKDEQDAVNRYKWYNTGLDMSSQELERMLYQRFELIFFYMESLDKFFLMPYAFDDGLDYYGRPIYVHPVPYANGSSDKKKQLLKIQEEYLRNIKLKVIYDVQLPENYLKEDGTIDLEKSKELLTKSCVIIRDYTPQFSENGIARVQMQDSLLDTMAECIPYMRTNLLNATGVKGMRVSNEDDYSNVLLANKSFKEAALNANQNIPIVGTIEWQELTNGTATDSLQFLQALQGLNNYRLSLYGLENTGLYEKNAYVNNLQSGISNVGLSLEDGKTQRQNACNIINSIWGINIWSDISETVSGMDKNMDGINYEDEVPEQSEMVEEEVSENE